MKATSPVIPSRILKPLPALTSDERRLVRATRKMRSALATVQGLQGSSLDSNLQEVLAEHVPHLEWMVGLCTRDLEAMSEPQVSEAIAGQTAEEALQAYIREKGLTYTPPAPERTKRQRRAAKA